MLKFCSHAILFKGTLYPRFQIKILCFYFFVYKIILRTHFEKSTKKPKEWILYTLQFRPYYTQIFTFSNKNLVIFSLKSQSMVCMKNLKTILVRETFIINMISIKENWIFQCEITTSLLRLSIGHCVIWIRKRSVNQACK